MHLLRRELLEPLVLKRNVKEEEGEGNKDSAK